MMMGSCSARGGFGLEARRAVDQPHIENNIPAFSHFESPSLAELYTNFFMNLITLSPKWFFTFVEYFIAPAE